MSTQYKARIKEREQHNIFLDDLYVHVIIYAKQPEQRRWQSVHKQLANISHRPSPREIVQDVMNRYAEKLNEQKYLDGIVGEFGFEVDSDFQIVGIVKQDD